MSRRSYDIDYAIANLKMYWPSKTDHFIEFMACSWCETCDPVWAQVQLERLLGEVADIVNRRAQAW